MEKTKAARKYLEEKQIQPLFEKMLLSVIVNQPDKPIDYLQQYLRDLQMKNAPKFFDTKFQKPVLIFVLGSPGSGKETQCGLIAEKFGYSSFSVRGLMQKEIEKGTERGGEIQELVKENKPIPNEWMFELLNKAIAETFDSNTKGYLIDAFPNQLQYIEEQMYPCVLVIQFECDEEVLIKRLMHKAETSGQTDVTEEVIKKRVETFQKSFNLAPVAEYYESVNKIAKINSGRPMEDVFTDVQELLSSRELDVPKEIPKLIFVLGSPGSGKETQCGLIVEKFEYTCFSIPNLFQKEIEKGTERGGEIQELVKEKKQIPNEWMFELLNNAITETCDNNTKGYLIDAIPNQLQYIEEKMYPCVLVIQFECDEEVLTKRLMHKAETSGQTDVTESVKARVETFQKSLAPVTEYYESLNKIAKINSGRTMEEVFSDVQELLSSKFN